jgi:hypothetical protein
MSSPCKITFTGLNAGKPTDKTELSFISWKQRIMLQQRQVEYTTRLGGSQLIISNVKNESPVSQVTAVIQSNLVDVKTSIQDLENKMKTLSDNVGTMFTWTDDNGLVRERCYIVAPITYNINAVAGAAKAIATVSMSIMTDIAPTTSK